ncbi:hypothetical protein N9W41_01045, partial [bacterium]|nr:hypothetical protein [bacterium]
FPDLEIVGKSNADDIKLMEKAVFQILKNQKGNSKNNVYECGHAGTVLRFLALRLAKIEGTHILKGSKRLFSRPQSELVKVLSQLGCMVEIDEDQMSIDSRGWRLAGDAIHVSGGESSQFLSSLLLSAWELPHDLFITVNNKIVSRAYVDLTVKMLQRLGMTLKISSDYKEIVIPKGQRPENLKYKVEMDVSSVFALACMAAVSGKLLITDFPQFSLQPDIYFLEVFRQMGIEYSLENSKLMISKSQQLTSIEVNINNCPDLFPCLAVLCLACEGPSKIEGLGQLKYKESDRLKVITKFLQQLGAEVVATDESVMITPPKGISKRTVELDSDQDHRIVMAGTLASYMGFEVYVNNPEVINKSFPEFINYVNPASGDLH